MQDPRINVYKEKFRNVIKRLEDYFWIRLLFNYIPVYLIKGSDEQSFYAFVDSEGRMFLTEAFFNFINEGKIDYACAILTHEALHIVLNHHQLLQIYLRTFYFLPAQLVRKVVNIACDAIVNDIVRKYFRLPEGSITFEMLDKIFGETVPRSLDGLIRYLLNKSKQVLSKIQVFLDLIELKGAYRGYSCTNIWLPPYPRFDPDSYYNEIARCSSGCAGVIPGKLLRHLKSILISKINWRKELSRFISSRISLNYVVCWSRPSRRALNMPGYKQLPNLRVWVLVDVSGSINDDTFHQFMAEVLNISKMRDEIEEIIAVFWDVDVCDVVHIRKRSDITKARARRGGGTRIYKALKYLEERVCSEDIIIVFTDGHISDINEPQVVKLINKLKRKALAFIVATTSREIKIPGVKNIRIPVMFYERN